MARRRYPSITKGADGLFHAWVATGEKRANGRPVQKHVKRTTPDEVEEEIDRLLAQKKSGAPPKPGRAMTLRSWLDTYLDTVAPRRCDLSTVKGYRSKMNCYVYPLIGQVRMDRLTPEHLDKVYLEMQRTGRADSTIVQVHRILSRALEVAFRRGHAPRNVAKLIDDEPTARRAEVATPDEAAAERVLDAARKRRNAARWEVGLGLGLRQGEALGLRWPFVELDHDPHIKVWWQLHRRSFEHGCETPCGKRRGGNCPQRRLPLKSGEVVVQGGLILKPPKGKSKGEVPLPPELVAALRAHREVQELERMMAGAAYTNHGFVFARLDGSPIDPSADWDEWQELEEEAGVAGQFPLHSGRHFAATFMLAQGVDVRVVQEILRHSSLKVTEGYTHVASKMAREATERMGRALFKDRRTP